MSSDKINTSLRAGPVSLLNDGESIALPDSGNTVSIFADNNSVAGSGNTLTMSGLAGRVQHLWVTGDSNTIHQWTDANTWVTGNNNTVTGMAGNAVFLEAAGTSNTVAGDGISVNLDDDGQTATLLGNNYSVNIFHNNSTLHMSNSHAQMSGFDSGNQNLTLVGDSNSVGGWSNSQVWVNGNNNFITGTQSSRVFLSAAGTTNTVAGNGQMVNFDADNQTLNLQGDGFRVNVLHNNDTINGASNSRIFTTDQVHTVVNGNYSYIGQGLNCRTWVGGTENTIQGGGAGSYVFLEGSHTRNTVVGDGTQVNLDSGDQALNLGGVGFTVNVLSNNNVITANKSVINVADNMTVYVKGFGNLVNKGANSNVITLDNNYTAPMGFISHDTGVSTQHAAPASQDIGAPGLAASAFTQPPAAASGAGFVPDTASAGYADAALAGVSGTQQQIANISHIS